VCPKCGAELISEWDILSGIWQRCSDSECSFRTPDQIEGEFHNSFASMDYLIHKTAYDE
jgi:hypothetical protein